MIAQALLVYLALVVAVVVAVGAAAVLGALAAGWFNRRPHRKARQIPGTGKLQ